MPAWSSVTVPHQGSQTVTRAREGPATPLDLIERVLVLERQIPGEPSFAVPRADEIELICRMQHRAVRIRRACRGDGKTAVIVLAKGLQEGVAGRQRVDAGQAHLDQAILQREVGALHAPFGLRRAGMNGFDLQGLERAGKRRDAGMIPGLGIDAEIE